MKSKLNISKIQFHLEWLKISIAIRFVFNTPGMQINYRKPIFYRSSIFIALHWTEHLSKEQTVETGKISIKVY